MHGGVAVVPGVQAWQMAVQADAPALDCAKIRRSDPLRDTRSPLTVRTPPLHVCSLVMISRRGGCPGAPAMETGAPSQFGDKTCAVPFVGVKLTLLKMVPPTPQHTQVEIRVAVRVPKPGIVMGPAPAKKALALHELLSALPQAADTTVGRLRAQPAEQGEPLALVNWPSGRASPGNRAAPVPVAVQPGQLQAGEAAEAELTVMIDGATHAAPPTIALFFRKSRLLCSMDRPLFPSCCYSVTPSVS